MGSFYHSARCLWKIFFTIFTRRCQLIFLNKTLDARENRILRIGYRYFKQWISTWFRFAASMTEHRVYWNNCWSISELISSYGTWTAVYISDGTTRSGETLRMYMCRHNVESLNASWISMWMFRVIRIAVVRIHVSQYVMINRHVNSHNPQLFPIYLARSKGWISYYNSFPSHIKLQTTHDWYNMIDEPYDDYSPFWGLANDIIFFVSIYHSLILSNSYLVISVIY